MPAGKVSLTVVVPVELDGPAFETVILYWPLPPGVNVPCATFATDRSKLVVTGVGPPVVAGPLPAPQVGHSFGFEIVTELAAMLPTTLAAMFTSKSSVLLLLDAIELLFVQVTFGTAPVHVQPGVEPALTLYPVTPLGKVSLTVVVPE